MKLLSCAGLVASVLVSACAIRSEDPEVVEVPITIKFPSVEASSLIDSIEIQVFDNSVGCEARMQQRRLGNPGQPLTTSGPVNICYYANGSAKFDAPLGDHVFVAIGTTGGNQERLSGCVQQVLGTDAAVLPIPLSLVGSLPAEREPPCSLADFCARNCN